MQRPLGGHGLRAQVAVRDGSSVGRFQRIPHLRLKRCAFQVFEGQRERVRDPGPQVGIARATTPTGTLQKRPYSLLASAGVSGRLKTLNSSTAPCHARWPAALSAPTIKAGWATGSQETGMNFLPLSPELPKERNLPSR